MEAGRSDVAAFAGLGDDRAATNLVSLLDVDLAQVRVDGRVAVGVAKHDELAVGLHLVVGGDADPVGRRVDRFPRPRADVDSVARAHLEWFDDRAPERPAKSLALG